MCVGREAGFCVANNFAIAISSTIIALHDDWLSETQYTGIVLLLSYILQQKNLLEVCGLHLQGFTNKTKTIK